MKSLKFGLRIWFLVTSVFSFLGGWIVFSHAPKPAPLIPTKPTDAVAIQPVQPLPTLAPVPTLDLQPVSGGSIQPLPAAPNRVVIQAPAVQAVSSGGGGGGGGGGGSAPRPVTKTS